MIATQRQIKTIMNIIDQMSELLAGLGDNDKALIELMTDQQAVILRLSREVDELKAGR